MEKIVEFIGNNYAWFLTITIILLFALIGYIVDTRKNKNDLFKKTENEIEEINIENYQIQEGKSLNEFVNNSKNINPDTKNVELTDSDILTEEVTESNELKDIQENINSN